MGLFDRLFGEKKVKAEQNKVNEEMVHRFAEMMVESLVIKGSPERRNALSNGQRADAEDFGYSVENPILTFSIADSVEYLARLRTTYNEAIWWLRTGWVNLKELHGVTGVDVDKYSLYLNGDFYKEICICPYGKNFRFVPKGLLLSDAKNELPYGGDVGRCAKDSGVSTELFLVQQKLEHEQKELERMRQEELRVKREEKMSRLMKKTETVRAVYPNFDLMDAMKNEFFSLLADSVEDMRTLYEYVHRDDWFIRKANCFACFARDCSFNEDFYFDVFMKDQPSKMRLPVEKKPPHELAREARMSGVTVEQYIALQKLEAQVDDQRLEKKRTQYRLWAKQAVEVKAKYPQFDLCEEKQNPAFMNMINHCDMTTVYEIIHFDQLFEPKQ